jgi:hypothetical protein
LANIWIAVRANERWSFVNIGKYEYVRMGERMLDYADRDSYLDVLISERTSEF